MNEIREKVVEVLKQNLKPNGIVNNLYYHIGDYVTENSYLEKLADALILSKLIFNPETDIRTKFKIGQEVWYIDTAKFVERAIVFRICKQIDNSITYDLGNDNWITRFEINLFATEAEAQAALEDMKCQNQLKPKSPN